MYQNKKSAEETTKLLEMFPHGVIIQSGDFEEKFKINFTNKEFNKQIRPIRNKVEELQKVEVVDDREEVKTNLHELLVSKQAELIKDKVIEQKKLIVK
jgi:hypothetical protein